MANEDPLLHRIRALLAKAESTEFEEERDSLCRKAEELIAKYGISQALLANAGMTRDKVSDRVLTLDDPYARQKADLLVNVARPLRVRVVFNTEFSRRIKGFRVHMFGYESDLQRVEILFTSLLVQAALKLATVRPDYDNMPRLRRGEWVDGPATASEIAAYRRDWLAGFGCKIENRLWEAENRAKQRAERESGTGMDLVLADRSQAVEAAVNRAYPWLGYARARKVRDGSAFREGVRAGAVADLGGLKVTQAASRSIATR